MFCTNLCCQLIPASIHWLLLLPKVLASTQEIKAFLSETYPGIDPSVLPNNLIRLMTSANLRGSLESKAILYPDSEPQPCPTVGWFHVWNSS